MGIARAGAGTSRAGWHVTHGLTRVARCGTHSSRPKLLLASVDRRRAQDEQLAIDIGRPRAVVEVHAPYSNAKAAGAVAGVGAGVGTGGGAGVGAAEPPRPQRETKEKPCRGDPAASRSRTHAGVSVGGGTHVIRAASVRRQDRGDVCGGGMTTAVTGHTASPNRRRLAKCTQPAAPTCPTSGARAAHKRLGRLRLKRRESRAPHLRA